MINLRDQILKSQIAYYNGLIAKHQQNVEIYSESTCRYW